MFNYDILQLLFDNMYKIKDILNFRIISKECNEIFKNYFNKIKVDIIPRSTFINFIECNVCYKKCKSIKQLIYEYDSLPHKCLLHCTNKLCFFMVIKRYLIDIKNNKIYPFCFIKNEDRQIFKNNNKILTNFYLETLKRYNGKWYIKIDNNLIIKQKYIKIKDISYVNNLNLFGWYLYRKNDKFY